MPGGVPGVAVGMAGAAALLMYAGFRGVDPVTALRDVATGVPRGLEEQTSAHQALWEGSSAQGSSGGGAGGAVQASLSGAAGAHPEFLTGAAHFVNDKYSQVKRWQDGYSDCSSFVGKALKAAGVTPPGASTTSSYLAWRMARPVSKGEIGAGDLLVSSGHMAIAITATTAIGQQNARQNVRIGPIADLMWGQSWTPLRYTGTAKAGSAEA